MGVLNVTPDSFSDGNKFLDPSRALQHAEKLFSEGADIIDVGSESTRPGSKPLSPKEEWQRLLPVLDLLSAKISPENMSIDTRHPETMIKAAKLKIGWINNINGVPPLAILEQLLSIQPNLHYIAMHCHGQPETMQLNPMQKESDLSLIFEKLVQYRDTLLKSGFLADRIYLDPGVGFGKNDFVNLNIIHKTQKWSQELPLLLGISRKGFIGRALAIDEPEMRDPPTKLLELSLFMMGAKIIRTHAVKRLRLLLDTWQKPIKAPSSTKQER